MRTQHTPIVVSFSGIDGAGKSTQIERLDNSLRLSGLSVQRFAFWDNVVFLPQFRAGVSHKLLRGELGVGAPGKPVRRNDKNARKWYLTLARSPFYLLDVLNLRRVVANARRSNADVVIFDRYIYDQLANVSGNLAGRLYARALLALAPRPDIAYLLDADPEAALARKPEYPLDFLHAYRRAYHRLAEAAREIVLVAPGDVDGVEKVIASEFRKRWPVLAGERAQSLQDSQLSA
ncbi:MAG TPA: thymidylate kinase [Terriglobales bacterium]